MSEVYQHTFNGTSHSPAPAFGFDFHFESKVLPALILTCFSGASTGLGGLLAIIIKKPSEWLIGSMMGAAAGIMLYLSFIDLLAVACEVLGNPVAGFWFFVGVGSFAVLNYYLPEPQFDTELMDTETANQVQLWKSGITLAIGISLHNFPEGIAVFLTALKGFSLGLPMAGAIALHNIPEGFAVALPIYAASKSRWKALRLSFLSGLAEPLAVVIVAVFFPSNISTELYHSLLALVGGIMSFLCIHELLPLSLKEVGENVMAASVFLGMMFMMISVELLRLTGVE